MPETMVSLALETLHHLVVEEAKFLSGVAPQVNEAQKQLQRMQCYLQVVDKRHYEEASARNFVKEIRELAYRIEDVVETYAVKVESKRQRRGFINKLKRFACVLRESISTHQVGQEIADITTEVTNLTDLRSEKNLVENFGTQRVDKCGCLPLAISVLGGILSENDSLQGWEMVNNYIDSYLKRGKGNERFQVEQVLASSYDDLPYHLKPCFLYLSCFQEHEKIDVEGLCLLWDQGKEEMLMDVAE
ncbi:hypothetical protein ACH5RR_032969 [Cinchona calisaya]|uniref:Disease resistance N-terminal domain-containing protein n=1 Tax=Cinchona calisaya TaxID=153742 RepID=A0ABD2YP07_9GENT